MYDVVIIGSGPAGTAAAFMCKKNRLNVAVISDLSKSIFYSNPNVSHTLHFGVIELAKKLGLYYEFSDSVISEFDSIRVSSLAGSKKDEINRWNGFHVCKKRLDENLKAKLIYTKGIELITDTATNFSYRDRYYNIETSHGNVKGRFVIDATGRSQFIGRKLRIREKKFSINMLACTGSSNRDIYKYKSNNPELIFNDNGWSWCAPDQINSMTWTNLYLFGKNKNSIRESIKGLNEKWINTTWRLYRPLVEDKTILAGDAGGILDPSAGQGIFNALISGVNAANCVAYSLKDPDNSIMHQLAYDSWFLDLFKNKSMALSQIYQQHGLETNAYNK